MTIGPYGQASRNTATASTQFSSLKDTLATLQVQLATGKVAPTYGGLGAGAATSLSLNARLARVNGYGAAISDAATRVNLASTGLQFLSNLSGSLGGQLSGALLTDTAQRGQVRIIARADLAEAIDVLNTDVNGRYLFAGRATDTEPVASLDAILNGAAGLKGVGQVVAERVAADLGSGRGGLASTVSGTTVTIGADTPGSTYGFTIASLTSTGGGPGVGVSGTPSVASLDVTAQPAPDSTISLVLNLPDGTTTTLSLTAGKQTSPSGDTFAIGATPADTAANLKTALDRRLSNAAQDDLSAASTLRATTDFFDGAYPPDQVVTWYRGEDDGGSARETGAVQVGDNQGVAIGLRANEPGLRTMMVSLAALAVTAFPTTGTSVVGAYNALASRTSSRLLGPEGKPAIDRMTTDLATASLTLGHAGQRAAAGGVQIQHTLDTIENATPEEVAAKLLALQTQLQASYQTTSALAKLSLTDYLS